MSDARGRAEAVFPFVVYAARRYLAPRRPFRCHPAEPQLLPTNPNTTDAGGSIVGLLGPPSEKEPFA
jgi:hypothetical protein